MKSNIILIFVFINFINLSTSQLNDQSFINFQVYNNPQCNGVDQNYGIGYSIALDSCITIDHKYSFVFTQNNIQISWDKYSSNSNNQCNVSSPVQPTTTYYLGQCIPADKLNFNSQRIANLQSVYYKLLLTNQPYFPSTDVIVSSYSVDQCNLNNNKLIEYYISGTEFNITSNNQKLETNHHHHNHNHHITYKYSCLNNKPVIQKCNEGHCYKPSSNTIKCKKTKPFYTYIPTPTPTPSNESGDSCSSAGPSGFTGCLPFLANKKDNGGNQIQDRNVDTVISINNPGGMGNSGTFYYNSIFCSKLN